MTNGSSTQTRASLLSRVRRHDSGGWNELAELYDPLIASWCLRRGLSRELAADCVQDVLASVAKSLDKFEPSRTSGSFRAWLWTITRHKIHDCIRREARHSAADGGSSAMRRIHEMPDRLSVEAEPTDDTDVNELVARAMRQIRDEFAPRTWRMFDRSVVDGIATSQVADAFDVSAATVRQTRSRILRRLRQQLGDLS